MKTKYLKYTLFLLLLTALSCKKNALDIKSDDALVVPSTLQDFQGMLDNEVTINTSAPALDEMSTDNLYLPYTTWQALSNAFERNSYIWAKDIFQGASSNDWYYAYQKVFYANVILDGLQNIQVTDINRTDYNNVKGQALFLRAYSFFKIAQDYAKPYIASSAKTDLGIVLRLTSDINAKSVRSTVQQTYDQITSDLLTAQSLLPVTPSYKTRASQPAAAALLARIYLTMGDYQNAFKYADASLKAFSTLLDYNTLNAAASYPVPLLNSEVEYHQALSLYLTFLNMQVDPGLIQSYNSNDLRLTVFYKNNNNGTYSYKGSYVGSLTLFGGIAADETYLIRAECNARLGNTSDAMNDLNTLLQKRYKTGTFTALTASSADNALSLILAERRKELVFRGLRWSDLRRLNQDPRFTVTLTRNLNGTVYTLPPNDPKYVFPISDNVITYSGIQQNPR
ncbi:MAG TPA: RagB/SusD family nutrient uptake outer membrane protein [Mucilaginibacter sp.]|nr:RagB/SusD family nutrient uptake outer membrane protein [Mucilaginibacter sp.]